MGVQTRTSTVTSVDRSHARIKSRKVKDPSGTRGMDSAPVNKEKPLPKIPGPVTPSVFLPDYVHTSTFQCGELSVTLESPSLRMSQWEGQESASPMPVYGDQNTIVGSVAFKPQPGPLIGRLNVHVEGSCLYICSTADMVYEDARDELHSGPISHRHIFHSSHAHLDLRASTNTMRTVDGAYSITSSVHDSGIFFGKLSPNAALERSDEHNFAFSFAMPRPRKPQSELPPSLTSDMTSAVDVRGRTTTDHIEVSYRFVCSWEPWYEDEEAASIEVPILIQPDEQYPPDVGLTLVHDEWSEIPLLADGVSGLPYHCLVCGLPLNPLAPLLTPQIFFELTLPNPHVYPRNSSIPFYITYTVPSTQKNSYITRLLATASVLRVFLTRELTIDSAHPQWSVDAPPAPPAPPSSSHEFDSDNIPPPSGEGESFESTSVRSSTVLSPPESESGSSDASSSLYRTRREKMLQERLGIRRRSAPLILFREPPPPPPQPPSPIPEPVSQMEDARTSIIDTESIYSAITAPSKREVLLVNESRVLLSDVSEGFTKKGKLPGKRRSDVSMAMVVPDGLWRGELRLNGGMLPSVDWAGMSVKYFVEASVLFDDHELKVKLPVRIY